MDERILREEGLDVDEVAYTCDDALVYLYFHLHTKVRQTTIESIMSVVGGKYGVRVDELFGFDATSSAAQGGAMHSHPGFWTLMTHEKNRHANFKYWINGRPDLRKGYLLLKRLAAVGFAEMNSVETACTLYVAFSLFGALTLMHVGQDRLGS